MPWNPLSRIVLLRGTIGVMILDEAYKAESEITNKTLGKQSSKPKLFTKQNSRDHIFEFSLT